MLRIAVCDDSAREVAKVAALLSEYGNTEFDIYTSSKELYEVVRCGLTSYDIFILDMVMPEVNGIELGKLIRRKMNRSAIVYLTISQEFAMQAYQIFAEMYLLKPVEKEALYTALDRIQGRMKERAVRIFTLRTAQGLFTASYSDIIYIEEVARVLKMFLVDGQVVESVYVRTSFETSVAELLEAREFIQIHKSFIVNMEYIKKITSTQLTLLNDTVLPISRRNTTNTKKAYLKFLADEKGLI